MGNRQLHILPSISHGLYFLSPNSPCGVLSCGDSSRLFTHGDGELVHKDPVETAQRPAGVEAAGAAGAAGAAAELESAEVQCLAALFRLLF